MTDRIAQIKRQTGETVVDITINLDGKGKGDIQTGMGIL
jgi:Imidazoleglycerol-phosphate dehydratase